MTTGGVMPADRPREARWNDLPPDWRIVEQPASHFRPSGPGSPIGDWLTANAAWDNLTRPQRQLLLSCAAGYPIRARADVTARLVARGLIAADLTVTGAGQLVVKWRTP